VIELTGKQKRALRGRGQRLRAAVIVGKAGLSPGTVRTVADHLGRDELVKVRFSAGSPAERKAAASRLADAVGAACVGTLGRTALLYRPREEPGGDEHVPATFADLA